MFTFEGSVDEKTKTSNVLLFMGAVTSPQRLCIVSELLPRFGLISFSYYDLYFLCVVGPSML